MAENVSKNGQKEKLEVKKPEAPKPAAPAIKPPGRVLKKGGHGPQTKPDKK